MGTGETNTTEDDVADLLGALERWVPQLLPDHDRAHAIVTACRETAARLAPATPFVDAVAAIERAAHATSRHLLLFVDPVGELVPDTADHGWPPPDLRAVRRRGGSVRSVHRSDDGIATMRIDALDPFDVAEPYLEAAIALTARATGVILDLRANGGGDPATVAFLAGFVLGPPPQPLSRVHHRDGEIEWETMPPTAAMCVPPGVPVAVLTSSATFSSGEALAYHLQARGRATVVGERTPGAADHATPMVLTRRVHAQLPVSRVVDAHTGSSWEGVGVRPDVVCEPAIAEQVALDHLRARAAPS